MTGSLAVPVQLAQPGQSNYRWYILTLCTLTNTITVAVPSMALAVLFAEISADLHLNLVQVGLIWGIGALPAILTGLLGGMIGDRIGPKRVVLACCLLAGLTGALRGLAVDFTTLLAAVLLFGLFSPMITGNTVKTCGMWFPSRQLGLANGVLSMGMALGFLLGSLLSATLLSPSLGGWRNVLILYGGLSILLCIPWIFTRLPARAAVTSAEQASPKSLRQTLTQVARIRNIWLLGLAIFGVGSCVQGTLGYLPLYLRGVGWPESSADGALAAFHTISMLCVIPIALASDKLATRRKVLVAAALMIILGVGSLSFARGLGVWIAVLAAGMVRDGFMAVFMTAVIETEGVGTAYSGTAIGFVMMIGGIGNLIAPALGNSLAAGGAGLPFVFWAALTGLGLLGLLGSRERSAVRLAPAMD
jgi:AAHS family 3-hydroxyphenylpropionic acid transporter